MTPQRCHTQVCLVSAQAMPNLSALLDPAWCPQQAVLLASAAMQARAEWLARVLRGRHMAVDIRALPMNLAEQAEQIRACLRDYPDSMLNATGGKKTMALTAFRLFVEAGRPVFYVETDNRLLWLNPIHDDGALIRAEPSLAEYLLAHGQEILPHATPLPHDTELVAHVLRHHQEGLSNFPALMATYVDAPGKVHRLPDPMPRAQRQLFELAAERGWVQLAGRRMEVLDKAGLTYLRGGWLEAWVRWELQRLGGFQSLAQDMKFKHVQQDIRNEIDVAALRQQQLYLVECKALGKTEGLEGIAYKLDTVRRQLGLAPRAALVIWAKVAAHGAHRERFKELRLGLLDQTDFPHLSVRLEQWLNRATN